MLEVSFPVTVPEPGHHMFLLFQNPLPENFAATHCSTFRGCTMSSVGNRGCGCSVQMWSSMRIREGGRDQNGHHPNGWP